jgi:hypothetical protein
MFSGSGGFFGKRLLSRSLLELFRVYPTCISIEDYFNENFLNGFSSRVELFSGKVWLNFEAREWRTCTIVSISLKGSTMYCW